jgi:benzoyl-CoA reductase/2-hydroxyglutaryl-CoA dehydratase subunit BcrC/BadD/HgdB
MATVRELEGVQVFEAMIGRMGKTIQSLKDKGAPPSEIYFWEALQGNYRRVHLANLEGQPYVMTGFFVPQELFHAMDIPNLCAENHATFVGQGNPDRLEALFATGEGYGLANEVCSPHRIAVALARSHEMPRPSFVVSTATSCDQTLKLYEVLADLYRVPSYMLDSPFIDNEPALQYAREDIKGLIRFLEERTGRELDWERLREVLEVSRATYDYWDGINELRKAVPSPTGGRQSVKDFSIMLTCCGREEGLRYFRARYEELKAKVDKGEGHIPQERHRIAWLYVLPMFDLKIADWLEEEYGAVIVMDSFGYSSEEIVLDTADPLDFLVKKPLKWAFIRQTYSPNEYSHFARRMARLCTDYRADVAIVLAHWSCNQYCGTIRLLKEEISGGLRLPFFVLDGDILDPRVVSSAQMRAKLGEFFAMVEAAR